MLEPISRLWVMRPIGVFVLTACFVFVSAASPISEANSSNITLKHEKRKRLKLDGSLEASSPEERSRVRNTEKHLLVFNRTMQILGSKVQEILNDSKKLRFKHSSTKRIPETVDLSRILKDKSFNGPNRFQSEATERKHSDETFPSKNRTEESNQQSNSFDKLSKPVVDEVNSNSTNSSQHPPRNNSEELENIHGRSFLDKGTQINSGLKPYSEKMFEPVEIKYNERKNESKKPSEINPFDVNYDLEMLNLSEYSTGALSNILKDLLNKLSSSNSEIDQESTPPCQMWADCRWKLQEVLISSLPSCPCSFPSTIFYDGSIWDDKNKRFYRWKDASGSSERLDVYKAGARHCIRSIATDLYSIAAQHCCYDKDHKLLTRGSGAGSPNLVSPDISPVLHYRIDILPWHHCKGDFTRYNKVRPPNNGNNCSQNPSEQEYQRQVDLATSF